MTFPLLEMAERAPMADASLEAFAHIAETLTEREVEVFLAVARYLEQTGHVDATGGEVADHSGISILGVRPRCTGLVRKGWLMSGAMRPSRCAWERPAHPVWLNVPRAAIERLRNQQKTA